MLHWVESEGNLIFQVLAFSDPYLKWLLKSRFQTGWNPHNETLFEIGINTEISFEIGIMDLKSNQIGIFIPCKLGLRDFTIF